MSAHHWGKAFAKRWVLRCVPNIVGLGFSPFLAVRPLTNGDVLLHFLLGWVIIGWGWGEEEKNVLFGVFLMTKVVLLASKWMVQKKEQTFKVFKRFLNGTWCMPRYGRKRFLVMSGFQETFLLKEVVTGKPEVTQSTQSPCLIFPLQCNGLASHEDRYFGNHSAMSEFISKCYSYTESTSRRGAPTHLPQCLETYYK